MLQSANCYIFALENLPTFKRREKKLYLDTKKRLIYSFNDSECRKEYKQLFSKSLELNLLQGKQLIDTNGDSVVINYEMLKNGEIAREVIGFCLTAKGKTILIEMVPALCFLFNEALKKPIMWQSLIKNKSFSPQDAILVLQINVILSWFLDVNWIEEFQNRLAL